MGDKRGTGKGLTFINSIINTTHDDCILWPYYISPQGYSQLSTHEGACLAHRYVCEKIHGQSPIDKPQAAHKCGVKSCVNPNHIRWSSQKENEDDKFEHGTWYKRISTPKLTVDQVISIREDSKNGLSYDELVSKYNIPSSTIRKVVNRWTWKHV